jgi:hypothetical protein
VYSLWLHPTLSLGKFSITAVVGMGALGFACGSISRGEEGFGLVAGIAMGVGAAIIAALVQRQWPIEQAGVRPPETPSFAEETSDTPANAATQEKTILQVAEQLGGEITVSQVALNTELPLDRVRDLLDSLADRKYCEKMTDSSGATVFRFHELLPKVKQVEA